LIASTESYYQDWLTKLIAFRTGIPVDRLIEGRITPDEIKKVKRVEIQLERQEFTLLPVIAPTIDIIEDEVKNGRYSYKWLLVDSIQKVSVPQASGIYDRTAFASNNLQRMAVENTIAVLSTTQVDRLIDRRTNKMPQASDAYGGAPVQQDSDVIISLYYHQHYVTTGQAEPCAEFPEGTALARIVKARWTASHSGLPLKFVGGVGFYPLADEREIPPIPYRRDVDNVQQVDFLENVPEKRKEPVYE
jgi:replicative DNA helicase